MVINLRGTSGAGKSHIVRAVMKQYKGDIVMDYISGRRQPISYLCHPTAADLVKPLFVPGHYETACGGCDTITKVDDTYTLVRESAVNFDVLFEGIMVQDDVKRAIELSKTYPLLVICLTTPIDQCIAGIQARRDLRGDERPLNPKNTIDRAERVKKNAKRLRAGGVEVLELDREAALAETLKRLGWVL